MRAVAHLHGFYLVDCIYSPAKQRMAIDELIDEFCERIRQEEGQKGCAAAASRLAVRLKDESFQEEREWRLISMPKGVFESEFRQGISMLLPYFKLPLGDDRNAYLQEVVVGPTPHPELAESSVTMLLTKLKLSNPPGLVRGTRIPCRNW